MNVIVIVVDTLRYDHIGAHGNDWIHTPNLDRLASESWVFDSAWSASYPTIPHHDRPTLPEAFGQAGWATQLIHDTPPPGQWRSQLRLALQCLDPDTRCRGRPPMDRRQHPVPQQLGA